MITISFKTLRGAKKIELTSEEFAELYDCLQTMRAWGAQGKYGDSERITDKKGYNMAERIKRKIDNALYN